MDWGLTEKVDQNGLGIKWGLTQKPTQNGLGIKWSLTQKVDQTGLRIDQGFTQKWTKTVERNVPPLTSAADIPWRPFQAGAGDAVQSFPWCSIWCGTCTTGPRWCRSPNVTHLQCAAFLGILPVGGKELWLSTVFWSCVGSFCRTRAKNILGELCLCVNWMHKKKQNGGLFDCSCQVKKEQSPTSFGWVRLNCCLQGESLHCARTVRYF